MKKHFFVLSFLVLVLTTALIFSFLPRQSSINIVHDRVKFPYEINVQINELAAENPNLQPGALHIITFTNFWEKCQVYILPCYDFKIQDVPQYGNSTWNVRVNFIMDYSDEHSLLARLCNWEARDLRITVNPGFNTAAMTVNHSDLLNVPDEWERTAAGSIDLAEHPAITDSFTVLTTVSNSIPNQETSADCTWSYTLYCCEKPIGEPQTFTLTQPYRVDCAGD